MNGRSSAAVLTTPVSDSLARNCSSKASMEGPRRRGHRKPHVKLLVFEMGE